MKIFKEEQRFRQLWLIILLIICALTTVGIALSSYIKTPDSISILELLSEISIILLVFGIIFLFKLTTRIDEKGIHYKFFPFHWSFKIIKWSEIDNAYVRTYNALKEYGGWGLKGTANWNTSSKGKAINVSGNLGIQLKLKNGKNLLIGTQKQENAKSVLATYKSKFNS